MFLNIVNSIYPDIKMKLNQTIEADLSALY
jgi:hypothetical protein